MRFVSVVLAVAVSWLTVGNSLAWPGKGVSAKSQAKSAEQTEGFQGLNRLNLTADQQAKIAELKKETAQVQGNPPGQGKRFHPGAETSPGERHQRRKGCQSGWQEAGKRSEGHCGRREPHGGTAGQDCETRQGRQRVAGRGPHEGPVDPDARADRAIEEGTAPQGPADREANRRRPGRRPELRDTAHDKAGANSPGEERSGQRNRPMR